VKIIKFNKKASLNNIVLALGNFDGVHLGHQKLLREAVKSAKKDGLSCFAMTFDPHPQEVVTPGRGLKLLTTLEERLDIFRALGLDGVYIKKFGEDMVTLSPEQFIKDLLVDHLKVKKVFVGYDFAFGKNRMGNIVTLKALGIKHGFIVQAIPCYQAHGHIVKSSTIRQMIADGDLNKAVKLMGRPYYLTGKVVRGMGRGKGLGFPTANLSINKDKLIPKHGVYFAKWGKHKCAVFIGSRPTFGESFAIEAYVIGFKGNIRNKTIRIELVKFIRNERHFSDVNKLKEQIKKDVANIKLLS
jgi:riboflavin kinase / FMN adenylyltransferase